MPSERMRAKARDWLYHPDHPNECATQEEVDDLATLLDEVRDGSLEEVAKGCDALKVAYPGDDRYERACASCALMIRERTWVKKS